MLWSPVSLWFFKKYALNDIKEDDSVKSNPLKPLFKNQSDTGDHSINSTVASSGGASVGILSHSPKRKT
jgi:hypothetical protein